MVFLAALVLAAPERILAVDGYVVGSRAGGGWTTAVPGFAKTHRASTFYAFGLGTVGARSRRLAFSDNEEKHGTFLANDLPEAMLGGAVPKAPRTVRVLPPSPVYEAVCRSFLASHGVMVAKAKVTRVLRVDLDGDGTDEVLIEASNVAAAANSSAKGAYSLVLLRALRGGKVAETPLQFDPEKPGGSVALVKVRGIADLDGDGRMEILTTAASFEGVDATLWGFRNGTATRLLRNGAGV